ncbi:hypothetical protein B0H66DRAFT_335795 [Apodospora peruviana]|uniref:Myb-like DNA-binding domain-containing protein n=1 Tax=Apodospora peruviana TaxID=516989 RepID=A0AAE0M228_9PEZI|nr:hypothetical protein B0H66DRAFT_335795 [Apodospora peruviana]
MPSSSSKGEAKTAENSQFVFLLTCVKFSAFGKVDFDCVAKELGIVSRQAAAKRYERLLKAHDIPMPPTGRPANPGSKQAKKRVAERGLLRKERAAAKKVKREQEQDAADDDEEQQLSDDYVKVQHENDDYVKIESDDERGGPKVKAENPLADGKSLRIPRTYSRGSNMCRPREWDYHIKTDYDDE